MKRSTDRILTTHMGSLPRPDMLADLLVAQAEGKPVDAAHIPALTDEAMDHVVRRQLDCGIDVGKGLVQRCDVHLHRFDELRQWLVLEIAGAFDAEVRRVDLQHVTLRHDELVFLFEFAGEREDVGLVTVVVLVLGKPLLFIIAVVAFVLAFAKLGCLTQH